MKSALSSPTARNNSIDILKAICAAEVVMLHCSFFVELDFHFAVPCFLMISGFFLYSPDKEKLSQKLVRAMKSIAILILWSTAVYFLLSAVILLRNGEPLSNLIPSVKAILRTLVVSDNLYGFHLWYLHAYLYVLCIVYFLNKWGKLSWLKWSLIMILVTVIFGKYCTCLFNFTLKETDTRNFLGLGLPFFYVGMWMKMNYDWLRQLKWLYRFLPYAIGLSTLLWALERSLLVYYGHWGIVGSLYVGSVFLSLSLMLMALLYDRPQPNWLSKIGKDYSLHIYIFHVLVYWGFSPVIKRLNLSWVTAAFENAGALIVLVVTLLLIYIVRTTFRKLRASLSPHEL